jgi:hypothetical protein
MRQIIAWNNERHFRVLHKGSPSAILPDQGLIKALVESYYAEISFFYQLEVSGPTESVGTVAAYCRTKILS